MPEFGEILAKAIEDAGITRIAFAKRVRQHPSAITLTIQGKRPPPKRHIAQWAKALGLDGNQANSFFDAAWLRRAGPHVQGLVARLEERIVRLEREVERLRAELERLGSGRRVAQTDPDRPETDRSH